MQQASLAVWSVVESRISEAKQWAAQLSVPCLLPQADAMQKAAYAFLLVLDETQCSLQQGRQKIVVDFVGGASRHRRLHGGGRGQAVAKAVGLKAGNIIPTVLDGTAGLGGDAFVLASLGCVIQLCERSQLAYCLLQDGLQRAAHSDDDSLCNIIRRMQLMACDAKTYMQQCLDDASIKKPDVVFLDPMFPEKRNNAAVKKEMAAFHHLIGTDADADTLLPLALQVAQRRVVVKRPRHAPPLAGTKPSVMLEGDSTRFDIYPLRSMASGE